MKETKEEIGKCEKWLESEKKVEHNFTWRVL
jgi:hypothetical protein